MRRTVWREILGPAALYGAALWLLTIFANWANARLGVRTGPWYIALLSFSVALGVPLAWTELFAQRSWLPRLTARVVLAWMTAFPLAAPFIGQDPFTAIPGHPAVSLTIVVTCFAVVGFLCVGAVAALVVAGQFGRRLLRRAI